MQIFGLVIVVIMVLVAIGLVGLGLYLLVGKLRDRRDWSDDALYVPTHAPNDRYGGADADPTQRTGYLGASSRLGASGTSGGISGVQSPPRPPDYGGSGGAR